MVLTNINTQLAVFVINQGRKLETRAQHKLLSVLMFTLQKYKLFPCSLDNFQNGSCTIRKWQLLLLPFIQRSVSLWNPVIIYVQRQEILMRFDFSSLCGTICIKFSSQEKLTVCVYFVKQKYCEVDIYYLKI